VVSKRSSSFRLCIIWPSVYASKLGSITLTPSIPAGQPRKRTGKPALFVIAMERQHTEINTRNDTEDYFVIGAVILALAPSKATFYKLSNRAMCSYVAPTFKRDRSKSLVRTATTLTSPTDRRHIRTPFLVPARRFSSRPRSAAEYRRNEYGRSWVAC